MAAYLLLTACPSCGDSADPPPPVVPVVDASPDVSLDASADVSSEVPADASAEAATADRSADTTGDLSADVARDTSVETAADERADVRSDVSDASIEADGGPSDDADPDSGDSGPPLNPTCTVDQPCVRGDCLGTSCDQAWECFAHFSPHPCPNETIPYCGCDGKTHFYPIACPEIPYLHAGACGDGANCDPADVRCMDPEPDCGAGKVASVVNGCYGPCVEITQCRCIYAFECPKRDLYNCYDDQRCDFNHEPLKGDEQSQR